MSDEHPDEEPGPAAPSWAVLPTMPWTRIVPAPRQADGPSPRPPCPADDAASTPEPVADPRPRPRPRVTPSETIGRPAPEYRQSPRPTIGADNRPGQVRFTAAPPAGYQQPPASGPGPGQPRRGTTYGGPPAGPSAAPHTARPASLSDAPAPTAPARPVAPRPRPIPGAPVSSSPLSGGPVSSSPVSGGPVCSPPVSSPPVSPAPVSEPPVSGAASTGPAPPVPSQVPADGDRPTAPAPPDPEQLLAEHLWRFDADTLREVVEGDDADGLRNVRDLLTAKLEAIVDNGPRARLLSLRAVVSRSVGDLDDALADGKLALAHAEATGELRRIAIAQARLAHVLQWRGEFAEADRLFILANSTELPDRLRATMHQHAGRCAYDQGRYIEACNHFERALELRRTTDPELIASTELALDAVFRRVAERGWGPYPRSREEILQIRRALAPTLDERTDRWGFVDDFGVFRITPRYTDVQPFRDGVAWVQRPGSHSWELVDETGRLLIDATAGYLGVGSFSDGIAWVSPNGATDWIAIDKSNTVLIATGFDDVRPFRRGLAVVRRAGRWGAVDGAGQVVVPPRYDGFATALHDGRYIDGFSDEGLAVVSLGAYKGVVDRKGRIIVTPVYPTLVIHPVAFLFADATHRWGALDRQGRPLLEPCFASRTDVTDEIDRLLVDTRPML